MKPCRYRVLCVLSCVLLCGLGIRAQNLEVIDLEGHATSVTAAQLTKLPRVTVEVKDHDTPAKFEGVPLLTVLTSAGIQGIGKMKGALLAQGLLIEAGDGYKVLFALAEIDPDFATREIILADKRDGKALDVKEGPFRIVVPGDKRPARWVREVTTVKIVAVK
jgi:hypothetical protein